MIKTKTIWKDSGYDCDHCGGEILLRTDRETGQPDVRCYQCRACGCQWTLDGEVQRVGTGSNCKAAAMQRGEEPLDVRDVLSRRLWILLALVGGAVLLRFGGVVLLRYLLPIIVLGVVVYAVVRYGRQQLWW